MSYQRYTIKLTDPNGSVSYWATQGYWMTQLEWALRTDRAGADALRDLMISVYETTQKFNMGDRLEVVAVDHT